MFWVKTFLPKPFQREYLQRFIRDFKNFDEFLKFNIQTNENLVQQVFICILNLSEELLSNLIFSVSLCEKIETKKKSLRVLGKYFLLIGQRNVALGGFFISCFG